MDPEASTLAAVDVKRGHPRKNTSEDDGQGKKRMPHGEQRKRQALSPAKTTVSPLHRTRYIVAADDVIMTDLRFYIEDSLA